MIFVSKILIERRKTHENRKRNGARLHLPKPYRRSSDRKILDHFRTHVLLNWQSFNFAAIFFPL